MISRGAKTPYELKQRVERSVGYFWAFPHSQFYSEPPRLVRLGLLEEEREQEGRRRRLNTITGRGRETLAKWVREPISDPPQIRDIGLLKLFFADSVAAAELSELARAQEQAHRDRLATYELTQERLADGSQRTLFPRETLKMGMLMERTFIEFWRQLAERPPSAE